MKDLSPKLINIRQSYAKCLTNLTKIAKKEFCRVLKEGRVEKIKREVILGESIDPITNNPTKILGQEIRVRNEVVEILGSNGRIYNWEAFDPDKQMEIYQCLIYIREENGNRFK